MEIACGGAWQAAQRTLERACHEALGADNLRLPAFRDRREVRTAEHATHCMTGGRWLWRLAGQARPLLLVLVGNRDRWQMLAEVFERLARLLERRLAHLDRKSTRLNS